MENYKGPFPGVAFNKLVAANVMPPLIGVTSGEITATKAGVPLGAMRIAGRITDVWLSVRSIGQEDAANQGLGISGEVFINAVAALTTPAVIMFTSGETAGTRKTTKVTGDTGIVQAVVDPTANEFSPGDVITYQFTIDRTSPTDEITDPVIVIELEPILD